MSKFYFYAAALFLPFGHFAQEVVSFENFTFAGTQNYWNGDDQTGNFTIEGATFTNAYNPQWFSWTGFSVSSAVDTTTSGWMNQYSSYAGSGANQSAKFGVWYANGEISFDAPTQPVNIALTNTTYAALSMKFGDDYAKKFGSIYNAGGDVDGTDGKDWFKLSIIGINANNEVSAEIEFYLADFRSEDTLEHFILDEWATVDLSPLGTVQKIIFEMSSSDNGDFGMNTPGYFALDDLKYYQSAAGLNQNTQFNFSIYPNPSSNNITLIQSNNEEFLVEIVDLNGNKVLESARSNKHILSVTHLPKGVYFAQMTTAQGTFTQKLVIAQ